MIAPPELQVVDRIVAEHGQTPSALIPILHAIQEHYGYLPEEALRRVRDTTEITAAAIAGVSTFYDHFELRPSGKHRISVCHGTACHVKGAEQITDALARQLRLAPGQHTDDRGLFTLGKVACVGCCTLAPAVRIGDATYGNVSADAVERVIGQFLSRERQKAAPAPDAVGASRNGRTEIRIGLDSCCVAAGTADVHRTLREELRRARVDATVKQVGCVGMCHQVPMLEVVEPGREPRLYARVNAQDVRGIVRYHFPPSGLFGRLRGFLSRSIDHLLTDESWPGVQRHELDVRDRPIADFRGLQKPIATEHSTEIDPLDIDGYCDRGGFEALRKCFESLSPDATIDLIDRSGLRGRGGGGYPTGAKWRVARDAEADRKFIVCNGDEGDPGAFMDRMILESVPFRVIEGLAIAAWAVGARDGIFYIRAEYPHAVERITAAIAICEERGLLRHDGFELRLEVARGAGAFVCGEETALIASLEGRRGMPRLRPPYPAVSGLQGKPTVVNNTETLAMLPWIVRNGPEAFAALGTARSKGTKVFALAGKIARGGLVEVPMGMTIREIIDDLGGGVAEGQTLKAVQIGGPSGGCVPASLADTPVDYESLLEVGAMMGSGGFVVLDDTDCMVDVARYFLQFTQAQSCGRCAPCRLGTRRLLEIIDRIRSGQGRDGDIELLEELAPYIQTTSLCGLGRSAPNPVLSTIRYFREEYEAHIQGRCPAGRCQELIAHVVNDACIGCTLCAQHCATDAIPMTPYRKHTIDQELCNGCGVCKVVCPVDAVEIRDRCPS